MSDRVLNATLIFYGIDILKITFAEGLFVSKLQVVCLQPYCKNFVTDEFLGIFQKLSQQLLFKTLPVSDFTRNYFVSALLVQFLSESTYRTQVLQIFFGILDKKLSHDLEITQFSFQDHVISLDKVNRICGIILKDISTKMISQKLSHVNLC